MAENTGYQNHPDPGPKPSSVGSGAKFTPIGTYQPLSQSPTSVNSKTTSGSKGRE